MTCWPPVCHTSTLGGDKSSAFAVLHIRASIFNCTYLRNYWWYDDDSVRVITHICCQIQRSSCSLRYFSTDSGQNQCNYCSGNSSLTILFKASPLLLVMCRQFDARYIPHMLPSTEHDIQFALCHVWSRSNPAYLYFCIFRIQYSIELFSAAIGDISEFRRALCSMLSNTWRADILFVLRQPSALTNPAYLQFWIFGLQYSIERISAAIGDMSTILRALYSPYTANDVLWHPVCAMSTLV